jgi:co-chaperonin GroES (HSP10)
MKLSLNRSGLKVRGEFVLVLLPKVSKQSAGGILLPDQITDREMLAQQIGTIVDLGSGAADVLSEDGINVGDVVLFPRYNGQKYPIDDEVYWVMPEKSILGKAERMPNFGLNSAQSSVEVFGAERAA